VDVRYIGYFIVEIGIIGAVAWALTAKGLMDKWFGGKCKALSAEIPWTVMIGIALVAGVTRFVIVAVFNPDLYEPTTQELRALAFRLALDRFSGIAVFGLLGGFAFRRIRLAALGQIVGAILGPGNLGWWLASLILGPMK
jgi:hypothetical protein